ncbi:MAG TPA: shikimate kinase [Candidatus Saccharimonadales bacterium]
MKLVLIGFMGSGKTTVAPILAEKLGLEIVEMDDLIVHKAGGKSIAEIFEAGGETYFRELETAVAKDLRNHEQAVISTGGGVVMSSAAMDDLVNGAVVIELAAPFTIILQRISSNIPRPLFGDADQAKALYELRKPLYSKYATVRVTTDGKSIEDVVREVTQEVKKL